MPFGLKTVSYALVLSIIQNGKGCGAWKGAAAARPLGASAAPSANSAAEEAVRIRPVSSRARRKMYLTDGRMRTVLCVALCAFSVAKCVHEEGHHLPWQTSDSEICLASTDLTSLGPALENFPSVGSEAVASSFALRLKAHGRKCFWRLPNTCSRVSTRNPPHFFPRTAPAAADSAALTAKRESSRARLYT